MFLTLTPAQVSAIMHAVVLPMINKLPLSRSEQTTILQVCLNVHQIQRGEVLFDGPLDRWFFKLQEEQNR